MLAANKVSYIEELDDSIKNENGGFDARGHCLIVDNLNCSIETFNLFTTQLEDFICAKTKFKGSLKSGRHTISNQTPVSIGTELFNFGLWTVLSSGCGSLIVYFNLLKIDKLKGRDLKIFLDLFQEFDLDWCI